VSINPEPEIAKLYVFSRRIHEQVAFMRFADGSAIVDRDESATIWEHAGNESWKHAIEDLQFYGFARDDS
jgi:hypothetical protein